MQETELASRTTRLVTENSYTMPSFETDGLLIGRAVELEGLSAALRAYRLHATPAVVRILGGSGIGKSTLLRGLLDDAGRSGWLQAAVTCQPAHRQRAVAVLNGVIRSLLRALGGDASRYTGGLEAMIAAIAPGLDPPPDRGAVPLALAPAQVEAVFLRLLQGILNDYPVVVALDDAAYADLESIRIIDYVLAAVAGYPFVVVVAGHLEGDTSFSTSLPTTTITLRPLADAQAAQLVERTFPGVPEEVTRAIVGYAAGVPLDVAMLAANAASENIQTADGVLDGVRAVVSSELRKTAPDLRRLLQLCSVIPEPVPFRLLVRASGLPEGDAHDVLTRDAERYLVRSGTTVRFRHRLIGDAVRATIVNEFVLKRRALDVQLGSADLTVDDFERIADLAADCGERELQRDYLMRLGDAAYRTLRFEAAVGYYRRAGDVRAPRPDEFVDFYTKFTISLRANDYDAEAARVLTDALRDGEEQHLEKGLGVLAAALIPTLYTLDELDRAARVAEHYFAKLNNAEDRSEILASVACMFADTMQIAQLEDALGRAAELPAATNYANAKLAYARATAESRLGDYEAACRSLKSAGFYAELDRSLLSYNIRFDQLIIDFRQYGNVALKERLPQLAREVSAETGSHAFATFLASFSNFLEGDWERATIRLAEINRVRFTPAVRARLMSVPAAMQAFSMQRSPYADELAADAELFVRELRERSAVQVGTWWIAYAANTDPAAAAPLAAKLRKWSVKAPSFSTISFMPVSLALYAERIGDRSMLSQLTEYVSLHETTPWMEANVLLARGVALHALGDVAGAATLRDSSRRFDHLGAPFLAAYAAARSGTGTAEHMRLLNNVSVTVGTTRAAGHKPARRRSEPTVRELEIARLVASGSTNRKIAEELFLSERTVEVHIANLFAKLEVKSRTHLARWVFEHEGHGVDAASP